MTKDVAWILLLSFFGSVIISVSNGQRFPLIPPRRRCPPHNPIPVNNTRDLQECRAQIAATRDIKDPNASKRTNQIIVENGYSLRTYNLTTSDGYILTFSRITGGKKSPPSYGKPCVLLQHGLSSTSEAWLVQPGTRNLAFKLADAGYDVWLSNQRGSDMSQEHVTLDKDRDIEYWDFSFQEMGTIDLPATIDLMLRETGRERIFYIGHSQGSVVYLVGASEVPEINDKIEASLLMAPAAYLGGAYIPLFTALLPLLYNPLQDITYTLFRGRFQTRDPRILTSVLGGTPVEICSMRAFQCGICETFLFTAYDLNPSQMNYTNMASVYKIFNTGNIKSYIHFGQNILSCQFRKYDYGPAENRRTYGTSEPPSYDLKKLTTPVHIYWAEQDSLITPPDIAKLVSDINPAALAGVHRVPDDSFDHAGFAVARDADILVYNDILARMSNYL